MNRIEALNILGLDSDATQEDIKTAYKECVQIMHPDRFANNKKLQDRATEQFKRLQDAYDYLTSGKGSKKGSSGSSGRRAYSSTEAQLAGLEAAKTQLVAQRDTLLDERRNALIMLVGGGIIALLLRRFVAVAGLAATVMIWGIVSLISTQQSIGNIDDHIKGIDAQRRKLENEMEEE
ncbi:J domain-containing protein [Slackia heliotrinireducens]|uniref:J domain-containing protein n=1 Tax=Slackia heliotrinireducens TaxID=84110 RepID=UPI0033161051